MLEERAEGLDLMNIHVLPDRWPQASTTPLGGTLWKETLLQGLLITNEHRMNSRTVNALVPSVNKEKKPHRDMLNCSMQGIMIQLW